MPEIWLPYGESEVLVTLQAENLGEIIEPTSGSLGAEEAEWLTGKVREADELTICDSKPATIQVLMRLVDLFAQREQLKIRAKGARRIEAAIAELRGRVEELLPARDDTDSASNLSRSEKDTNLVVATAEPDPLFGIIDAKVALGLSLVPDARSKAYQDRRTDEPSPLVQTKAYDSIVKSAQGLGSQFVTVVPRAGNAYRLLKDTTFSSVKASFTETTARPSRAAIIGVGGRGYDDTLSSGLRMVWNCVACVKEGGEILLLCECADGLGSQGLEMMVTGRLPEERGRPGRSDNFEDINYLRRLKESFNVILLSGLPDLYAKTKLGLTSARGAGEGLNRLLGKAGRTAKVTVVSRAAECVLAGG